MTAPIISAENALTAAIFDKLSGKVLDNNSDVVPVYSQIPEGMEFPYIRIGEQYGNDSFRTKTNYGESIMATIHAFSQAKGTKEIENITAQIKAILMEDYLDLNSAGFTHVVKNLAESRIFQDQSGSSDFGYTNHAAIRIEFKIQKN